MAIQTHSTMFRVSRKLRKVRIYVVRLGSICGHYRKPQQYTFVIKVRCVLRFTQLAQHHHIHKIHY